ncbi:helix-turn-helix domain-containing protein [Microbaculum marinum]|uniref:Helix-turn-helix domain-containing protein n=1 Tax=Microbaculum marinum TaxID=1764581 RepID=A0AAW9RU54_9HYPH
MDKRDLGSVFRDRLGEVMRRYGGPQSRFAESIGLDRSALSQLLSGKTVRLPRAETLVAIAEAHGVSLDWLMGVSQSERLAAEIAPHLALELGASGPDDSRLQEWRREAAGYKIRHVPATLPDLLRTEAVIRHELGREPQQRVEASIADADRYLAYTRRPETDMEVCMPVQRLTGFARGEGMWATLDREVRHEQLAHMARLLEELYPTFRLFLYDARRTFSAPITIFGPMRAAIYLGDMYLVLTTTEHIRVLIDRFDGLIRQAVINPHEVAARVSRLTDEV